MCDTKHVIGQRLFHAGPGILLVNIATSFLAEQNLGLELQILPVVGLKAARVMCDSRFESFDPNRFPVGIQQIQQMLKIEDAASLFVAHSGCQACMHFSSPF